MLACHAACEEFSLFDWRSLNRSFLSPVSITLSSDPRVSRMCRTSMPAEHGTRDQGPALQAARQLAHFSVNSTCREVNRTLLGIFSATISEVLHGIHHWPNIAHARHHNGCTSQAHTDWQYLRSSLARSIQCYFLLLTTDNFLKRNIEILSRVLRS